MNILAHVGVMLVAVVTATLPARADEPAADATTSTTTSTTTATAITARLTEAVRAGRLVTFTYKGYERTVEPHALGTANDGKPALLGWQTSGGSSTEPPPGWRVFLVTDIALLKTGGATFVRRADYHQGKSRGLKSITVEGAAPAE